MSGSTDRIFWRELRRVIHSRAAREFSGIWKSRLPSAAQACRVPLGRRSAARRSADGTAHGTAENFRSSATVNYRVALEFNGVPRDVLRAARRAAATGRGSDRCLHWCSARCAARRTPCGEGSADRPAVGGTEGRCARPSASLALAGCGDPAYPQRHRRAAFPSAAGSCGAAARGRNANAGSAAWGTAEGQTDLAPAHRVASGHNQSD